MDKAKTTKWCPAADCGKVVENKFADTMDVSCTCGKEFCFKCTEDPHGPIDCETLERWKKVIQQSSSAAERWIARNTKKCP